MTEKERWTSGLRRAIADYKQRHDWQTCGVCGKARPLWWAERSWHEFRRGYREHGSVIPVFKEGWACRLTCFETYITSPEFKEPIEEFVVVKSWDPANDTDWNRYDVLARELPFLSFDDFNRMTQTGYRVLRVGDPTIQHGDVLARASDEVEVGVIKRRYSVNPMAVYFDGRGEL